MSTTASPHWCRRSPGETPIGGPRRRSEASPSTSVSRGLQSAGTRWGSSTSLVTSDSSRTCSPGSAVSTSRCSWSPRMKAGCRSPRNTSPFSIFSAWHTVSSRSPESILPTRTLIELSKIDVDEHVVGSVAESWPVVTVSAVTGEGIDDLVEALETELTAAGPTPDVGRPRMWIDRAFGIYRGRGCRHGNLDGRISLGRRSAAVLSRTGGTGAEPPVA